MVTGHLERKKVFISYSHQDKDWLARLRIHLKPLEREFAVDIWDDTKIVPGSKWREEIEAAIESARVAVLLVSADFLASDFIATDELPPLLSAAEQDGAIIIPLILSPSRFLLTKSLNQFQSLNDPSMPLISLSRSEQEAALVKLTEVIEKSLASVGNNSPFVLRKRPGLSSTSDEKSEKISTQQNYRPSSPVKRMILFKNRLKILMVLIAVVATCAVFYWQFIYKPSSPNSNQSRLAQPESTINVLQRGLRSNDPNFDNTPWFNKLVANIDTNQIIYFPSGKYYFHSRPNVIMKPLVIKGDGVSSTNLIRNFNGRNHDEAFIHTNRTLKIDGLSIIAMERTSHGGAIRLDNTSASGSILRDLRIMGESGGTFDIPLTLFSNESTGIRGCIIENVELFAATIHLAWFINVHDLTVILNGYSEDGTVDHVTIQAADSELKFNSKLRSEGIHFTTSHLATLYVYTTNDISLFGFDTTDIRADAVSKPNIKKY